jgi:hypothetical protein
VRAFLRRRPEPSHAEVVDPRADELRRRLDESRGLEQERDDFEARETSVDQAEPADADARRRDVHDRARAAIDEMQRPKQE